MKTFFSNRMMFSMLGIIAGQTLILSVANAQSKTVYLNENEVSKKSQKLNIEYTIYYQKVFHSGKPERATRNIDILLNEQDFSGENLKTIFMELSEIFPDPITLCIYVVTSREQIPPGGHAKTSVSEPMPNYYNHHRGIYFRSGDSEFFRYTVNPTDRDLKTIAIK